MKQQSIDSVPPTPGSLLKAGRQENDWSIDDIAKALRMSASQVEAIEADDTEQLHGITYIRGYWVNYARLLDVDIEESIEYHKSRLLEPPSMMTNPQLHTTPSTNERKKKNAAILFGIFAIAGCVALYFFQPEQSSRSTKVFENVASSASNEEQNAVENIQLDSHNEDSNHDLNGVSDESVTSENVNTEGSLSLMSLNNAVNDNIKEDDITALNQEDENTVRSDTDLAPSEVIVTDNDAEASPASSLDNTSAGDLLQQQEELQDNNSVQNTAETSDTQIAKNAIIELTETQQVAQNIASEVETSNNNGNTQNADVQDSQSVDAERLSREEIASRSSANAPDTVVFYNTQTSWFDVRDGQGNILVYEDIPANQVLSLKGRPPFYVYSTNAGSLTIAYMGKIFAHQSQIVDNSIRLKISQ